MAWLLLAIFYKPLPNDHAPLFPAKEALTTDQCPAQLGTIKIALGRDRIIVRGNEPRALFRIGACPGPSLVRTSKGLLVSVFGYDDDGTVIYQIRNNQFTLLLGDYLHLHRPDQSSFGIYDKWEREIFYIRYFQGAVRIRGRFLCGDVPVATISDTNVRVGDRDIDRGSCLNADVHAPIDYAARDPQ